MGGMLNVHCRQCGAVSNQVDGATMMGFNPRCERCGRTKHVSLQSLYAFNPPGLEPGSREARDLRDANIPVVAGKCRCGGRFSETAVIRCTTCRTTEVDIESIGTVD